MMIVRRRRKRRRGRRTIQETVKSLPYLRLPANVFLSML